MIIIWNDTFFNLKNHLLELFPEEDQVEEDLLDHCENDMEVTVGEIVPVLTLTAPTGPAAPSQCPFRVRTGHPIIA